MAISMFLVTMARARSSDTPQGEYLIPQAVVVLCPDQASWTGCAVGLLVTPVIWAATPFLCSKKNRDQKGFLGVAYARDRPPTILKLWGSDEPEALLDAAVGRLQEARRKQTLEEGPVAASEAASE